MNDQRRALLMELRSLNDTPFSAEPLTDPLGLAATPLEELLPVVCAQCERRYAVGVQLPITIVSPIDRTRRVYYDADECALAAGHARIVQLRRVLASGNIAVSVICYPNGAPVEPSLMREIAGDVTWSPSGWIDIDDDDARYDAIREVLLLLFGSVPDGDAAEWNPAWDAYAV